ncbi:MULTISPECIES: GNAT family N-acetyltransferase [Cyanophyceae]|uniref:GNAT family N-acetyltransferase n=1 Tax=Leptolyngbya subtilissima DQ-A4 TaxID=2933933 RepID=A0ABV0K2P9_9CYAN|nr:GNAT family N-acetyltransferase [Nodosilinea sp. FACHB-141]MBD2113021.1 GNAT family N-acetyltransferase [Nodosilinea sp. FACHB-141]
MPPSTTRQSAMLLLPHRSAGDYTKLLWGCCWTFKHQIMPAIAIVNCAELQQQAIDHLVAESQREGFRFMKRLVEEYDSGVNRFDQPGEALLTAIVEGAIVGIGGLNRDPYFHHPNVGRLRRVYVEAAWRRRGVGRVLVTALIDAAQPHYQLLTLRTDTAAADAFYQTLGFKTEPRWTHTTHHLQLGDGGDYQPGVIS